MDFNNCINLRKRGTRKDTEIELQLPIAPAKILKSSVDQNLEVPDTKMNVKKVLTRSAKVQKPKVTVLAKNKANKLQAKSNEGDTAMETVENFKTPQVTSFAASKKILLSESTLEKSSNKTPSMPVVKNKSNVPKVKKIIKFDVLMQQLQAVQKEVAKLKEVQEIQKEAEALPNHALSKDVLVTEISQSNSPLIINNTGHAGYGEVSDGFNLLIQDSILQGENFHQNPSRPSIKVLNASSSNVLPKLLQNTMPKITESHNSSVSLDEFKSSVEMNSIQDEKHHQALPTIFNVQNKLQVAKDFHEFKNTAFQPTETCQINKFTNSGYHLHNQHCLPSNIQYPLQKVQSSPINDYFLIQQSNSNSYQNKIMNQKKTINKLNSVIKNLRSQINEQQEEIRFLRSNQWKKKYNPY